MVSAETKRQFLTGAIDLQAYRELVRDSARGIAVRAPATTTAPRPKPAAAPAQFWDIVSRKEASGMARGAAVRQAVVEHGAEHDRWLASIGAR